MFALLPGSACLSRWVIEAVVLHGLTVFVGIYCIMHPPPQDSPSERLLEQLEGSYILVCLLLVFISGLGRRRALATWLANLRSLDAQLRKIRITPTYRNAAQILHCSLRITATIILTAFDAYR